MIRATVSPISFDEAIAVRPAGDGCYVATTYPSWDALLTTHGGILAALAIQAIEAECNPDHALQIRSITCHYMRPPAHGDHEVKVELLRAGRRMTYSRSTHLQEGRPFMSALAIHSARGLPNAITFMPPPPKAEPAPAREADFVQPIDYRRKAGVWLKYDDHAPKFLQKMHVAPQFGDPPYMGPEQVADEGTVNGGWAMPIDRRPVDPALLGFMVDLFWPSAFQPLRKLAMAPTLDMTIHFRAELPPGGLPDQPLLIHNTTTAVTGGTGDSDSRVFAADGTLLAQARQLQMLVPIERPQ